MSSLIGWGRIHKMLPALGSAHNQPVNRVANITNITIVTFIYRDIYIF